MENVKFYEKKLEGLEIIRGYLTAIDRVYGDLVELEDIQTCGSSHEEYAHLRVALDDLQNLVTNHVDSTHAMVEMAKTPTVPQPTASEVHAIYVSSLR